MFLLALSDKLSTAESALVGPTPAVIELIRICRRFIASAIDRSRLQGDVDMSIMSLWQPILASAALVFIAASVTLDGYALAQERLERRFERKRGP